MPGKLIASRFEVAEPIGGDRVRRAFTGTDREGGASVLLVELTAEDLERFERARSTSHAHMARLIDVIATPNGGVLVAEHVGGTTLAELVGQIVRKTSVDAVRWALRVADAVSALHAQGVAHGWLDPGAIIAEPAGHPAPVVTWLPPERGESSYRSPGRTEAEAPSEADDTWATSALLYFMLTGEPPPSSGFDSDDKRLEASINDDALRVTLTHGLAASVELRALDLRPLKRELARWFVEHAGEEISISGHPHPHSRPPPLPPGASSTPPAAPASVMPHSVGHVPAVASSTPPASARPRRLMAVLGAALVVGLLAAWGVSAIRSKPRVVEVEVPTPQAPASASEKEIALNEIPVTGQSDAGTGDKMATCVAAYLPKGSLVKAPDMSWMCKERDPREGAGKLRTAVVQGAPPGAPTEAMKLFSRLGWYDMAAFAVIRSGCCEEAEAVTLPDPSPKCKRMDEPLRELGRAVIENQNHEAHLKSYTEAILCEVGAGRASLYRRAGRPQGGEDTAFQDLVKVIQTP